METKGNLVGSLKGIVAVVTGASRGVGRGVALALGEAGATVYVTGRTTTPRADLPGTLPETAALVTKLGGEGIALVCDHTDDAQVAAAFARVLAERGRLDILVNSAWGGYENMFEGGRFSWPEPFWQQPLWRWDAMFVAGVRAAYVTSGHAARQMVAQGSGLIANISFWAAQKYLGNVAYGCAKAATDKLTADMALELRPHGVAAVSVYPGMVRTERVLQAAAYLDLSNSESPQFVGRVIAALAADPDVLEYSGRALIAAEVARRYGVTDVDGRRPRPLSLAEA